MATGVAANGGSLGGTLRGANAQSGADATYPTGSDTATDQFGQQYQNIDPLNGFAQGTQDPMQDPMVQQMLQAANQAPPPGMPVPGVPGPAGTFASMLAANMGAMLLRHPAYAAPTIEELQQQRQNQLRVQMENQAQQYAATQQSRQDRLNALMRINQIKLEGAQRAGDIEMEGKLQAERFRLEEQSRETIEAMRAAAEERIARITAGSREYGYNLRYLNPDGTPKTTGAGGEANKLRADWNARSAAEHDVNTPGGRFFMGNPDDAYKYYREEEWNALGLHSPDYEGPAVNQRTDDYKKNVANPSGGTLPETVVTPKNQVKPPPTARGAPAFTTPVVTPIVPGQNTPPPARGMVKMKSTITGHEAWVPKDAVQYYRDNPSIKGTVTGRS